MLQQRTLTSKLQSADICSERWIRAMKPSAAPGGGLMGMQASSGSATWTTTGKDQLLTCTDTHHVYPTCSAVLQPAPIAEL